MQTWNVAKPLMTDWSLPGLKPIMCLPCALFTMTSDDAVKQACLPFTIHSYLLGCIREELSLSLNLLADIPLSTLDNQNNSTTEEHQITSKFNNTNMSDTGRKDFSDSKRILHITAALGIC